MARKHNAAANVSNANDKLVELIVNTIMESIDLEEVVASVVAGNATPAREPKARTREEALTERYGDAEHRKANVSRMKSCYDQSWEAWTEFRQTLKGLKRSEIKAFNQTVSGLARKAGYAGETLDRSFFQKLVAGVR